MRPRFPLRAFVLGAAEESERAALRADHRGTVTQVVAAVRLERASPRTHVAAAAAVVDVGERVDALAIAEDESRVVAHAVEDDAGIHALTRGRARGAGRAAVRVIVSRNAGVAHAQVAERVPGDWAGAVAREASLTGRARDAAATAVLAVGRWVLARLILDALDQ